MKHYTIGTLSALESEPLADGFVSAFLTKAATEEAYQFHKQQPSYAQTPLVRLDGLAKRLGVQAIFVKDESHRFGLNAFKGLGGLYALSKLACRALGCRSFSDLSDPRFQDALHRMTFVTATDGNHGRGVAWAAHQLGCQSHVYLPVGSSPVRAQAIRDVGGTEVRILELEYDDTVRYAATQAEKNGWFLVQDTSFPGYEEIPQWIIQGYTTMAREAAEQLSEYGFQQPTHVFLQAGVGAMAGGVLGYLANHYAEAPPIFSVVEPSSIPCIYRSVEAADGLPHPTAPEGSTCMAGLNCGEPCTVTWPILRDGASFYFSCPDTVTELGMRLFAHPTSGDRKIISGESGAVTVGLAAVLAEEYAADLRQAMQLDENSILLLFSTEGDTDPAHYAEIVQKETISHCYTV